MTTTHRPTRQQSRSQRTRDQIAAAALGVFATKGYAEASMDDVCTAAGCSKGGLYHHFPAKTAVLEAVIERLRALGGLEPPVHTVSGATGLDAVLLERLLLDLWAEAARSPQLRTTMHASGGSIESAGALAAVLEIGAMVQRLALLPDSVGQPTQVRPAA